MQELKKKKWKYKKTLTISNEEMNDIMKTLQALQDSNIFLKGVTKTIKNKTKEEEGGSLSMLLGTLGASLLGNLLTGKGIARAGTGCPFSSVSQKNRIFNAASSFNKGWGICNKS